MRTPFVRRAAAAATLVIGITAMTAQSAQAVLRDTDYVHITYDKADFGDGIHLWGSPQENGVLTWDESSNGVKTGTLTGRVYWDDFTSGGCARVRIQLYSVAGTWLGTADSDTACRVGGGSVTSKAVNISLRSTAAHKMVITTQKAASPTSRFHREASVTRYWGEVHGRD